jgi:hypothetical protein
MLRVFKVPLILFGIAVLTAIALYISKVLEKKKESAQEKLFNFNSLNITEVSIKRRSRNDEVRFKRLGEDLWEMVSPVTAEADPYVPNGIARRLEDEKPSRSFKRGEVENLSDFGIEPPDFIISLKDKDGKEYKLLVGKKAPIGYSAYATKEGDENIYLVSASILNDLNKEVKDYRNRKIMDFSTSDLARIKIKRGKEELTFEKETEERWRILPMNLRGSNDQISKLVSTVKDLKVVDFVDDSPTDLKIYGLSSPDVIIEVQRKEKEPLILKLGKRFKKDKEELVYAMKEGKNSVYSIGATLYDECMKKLEDFREKKPISFYTWKTKSLNISTPKGNYIFEKEGEENWFLTIGSEKIKAKSYSVEDLLRDIRNIEVEKFVDDAPGDLKKYGLDNPPYIVKITAEGESPVEVLLSPSKDGVYFKLSNEPYIYLTKSDIIVKLEIEKEKFKEEEKGETK